MATVDAATLLASVSPPLDDRLTGQMLDEFASLERRYVLGDWEPATLDGGQFCEATARILYHQDSGDLNRRKAVDKCLKYVEEEAHPHKYPDGKSRRHTARVLRAIYKFRSDRGAVHLDPDYTANQLDAKFVMESVRWVLSEMLRVFWTGDRALVAQTVREIVEYDVPAIGDYEGHLIVLRTDCSAEEEVLLLLHHGGTSGLSRAGLGKYVKKSASSVSNALKQLGGRREVIQLDSGAYRLTASGTKRVLEDLAHKLTI